MSGTLCSPQNTSPSFVTEMVMFSGLVWVGMLTAFGTVTGTFLVMTGMVIRKMISSTNMTSTSGVVLISDMIPPSSPVPTLIAMVAAPSAPGLSDPRTAYQIGMQVAGEIAHVVLD